MGEAARKERGEGGRSRWGKKKWAVKVTMKVRQGGTLRGGATKLLNELKVQIKRAAGRCSSPNGRKKNIKGDPIKKRVMGK